jgi:hypothetical protein
VRGALGIENIDDEIYIRRDFCSVSDSDAAVSGLDLDLAIGADEGVRDRQAPPRCDRNRRQNSLQASVHPLALRLDLPLREPSPKFHQKRVRERSQSRIL